MSKAQSFGSSCHQNSQSRKISIGIIVESSAKKRSGFINEQEVAVPTTAVANFQQRDLSDRVQLTAKGKQTETLEQAGSPWIRTKSNHNKSTSRAASHGKLIQSEMNMGMANGESNGFETRPLEHPVKLFPKQIPLPQSDTLFKGMSNGQIEKGENRANSRISGKLPCTNPQEQDALTSKIGDKAENTVNGRSEALKMKLWELLGTVSSPNKDMLNSQTSGVHIDYQQPEGTVKQADATAVKSRRNSDTIETDSESPDCASKRAVTRSLTRKKASPKLKQDKVRCGLLSTSSKKPGPGERNIFSFQEGWYVGLQGAANGSPSTRNTSKRTRRKGSQIEPCKVSVERKKYEKKNQKLADKKQNPCSTDKPSSGGSRGISLRHVESHVTEDNILPKGPTANEVFPEQTTSKPSKHADVKNPSLADHQDMPEDISKSSSETTVDPEYIPRSQYTPEKSIGIDKHKTSFQPKRNEHRTEKASEKNKSAPAAEKSGSCRSGANKGCLSCSHSKIDRNRMDRRSTDIKEDLLEQPAVSKLDGQPHIISPELPRHQSPREEDINSPASPRRDSQNGDFYNPSFKDFVDPQEGVESPIVGRRSPVASYSLGLRHTKTQVQQGAHSLAEELMSGGGGVFSFGNINSQLFPERSGRDELQDSPPGSSAPQKLKNDLDDSSSEDSGSENSEEGPGIGAFYPETGTAEKPKFMLRRTKRLRSFEGILQQGRGPASVSREVTREYNSNRQPEEHNIEEEEEEEDGLPRAIKMLVLALEKLKSKVKLLTSKRSSEILASVAEQIHEQLHSVESHIQTDTCKLASLSKQKRKRLETEFHGQEEQLTTIYTNFKKEIGKLLEDCKGTIEGLEDSHIELKGMVEKQKASHRKLLLQVQEAVVTQLHDAEKRITAVNQSAREQMLQLKLVMAECLEGGVLS